MRFLVLMSAALVFAGCDVAGRPARGRTEVTFQGGTPVADNVPVNFTVTVRDAEGHPVKDATVTYKVDDEEGITFTGNGDRSGKDGVVKASIASTRVGERQLTVTIAGSENTISLAPEKVTFVPGAPEALKFVSQPTLTRAGIKISPAVTVEVLDHYGNRATNGIFSAYVELVRSSGGVVQNGGSAAHMIEAVQGLITFDNLIINKPQTGYALRARTAENNGPADESAQFDVLLGNFSAATSTVNNTPTVSLPADGSTAFTITMTARDDGGNPLADEQPTFSVSPPAGCAFDTPATLPTTGDDGVTTPGVYLRCTASGAKTVTATIGTVSVSAIVSFY